MNLARIIIVGLSLTIPQHIYGEIFSVHCPLGCPENPNSNDLVFKHVYAFSNNPTTKFPDWVAYEIDILNFGDSPGRQWKPDPLLDDASTLEKSDYTDANKDFDYERGHLAPLAAFAGSRYWSELNHLSNIAPMKDDLNGGPWEELEGAGREAVAFRDSVYVLVGPLYESQMDELPKSDESHRVPSGFWKIF